MLKDIPAKKNGSGGSKPLSKINTMVNMPMQRFRDKQGALSWEERDGSSYIERSLMALFKYHNFDPVRSGNSIIGFGKNLEGWESELIKLKNLGRFTSRAGKKPLDEWTRYQRNVLKAQKTERKDPALYMAVMGRTAPELDLSLKPKDHPGAAVPLVKPRTSGVRTQTRRRGQSHSKCQSMKTKAKQQSDGSDTEEDFDVHSETDSDEECFVMPVQRRSSRAKNTTKIGGFGSDGLSGMQKQIMIAADDNNDEIFTDDSNYVHHQSQRRKHVHRGAAKLAVQTGVVDHSVVA